MNTISLRKQSLKLLEPLPLHSSELSNRYVMGSMHTGLEDNLKNIDQLTEYYVTRARGKVGMIITGGYSPNIWGRLTPFAGTFSSKKMVQSHLKLTSSVHAVGPTKILLQLLHAGRYSFHPFSMAPSKIKSPITPFTPFAMPEWMVKKTIKDFISASSLAHLAGYDGVEIMGSEGYLLHQFFAEKTNKRKDIWGGSLENRCRFALQIISGIRQKLGSDFIIVFRIPILDLLSDGSDWNDIVWYAKELQKAGVSILNSGIGWHESRVPTIASMVPEAAFVSVTQELKKHVQIPVIASNRFSEPSSAEMALQNGSADLISMARPFLADPNFVKKVLENRTSDINPCIACNQACLDHVFAGQKATCMVNPTAVEESKWNFLENEKTNSPKKIAVIGAGAAGLNAAIVLLKRGHSVTVFEQSEKTGGQFNLAALIPGKADYQKSIDYWQTQMISLGGELKVNMKVTDIELLTEFDHFVVATGVVPRKPKIQGSELEHVYYYDDFIKKKITPKEKIVIIGAGGIGIDIACSIVGKNSSKSFSVAEFFKEWSIDPFAKGGLKNQNEKLKQFQITLMQRSEKSLGKNLGKTTGWIHRLELKKHGVQFLNNLDYEKITLTDVEVKLKSGDLKKIPAEQVIICAGQESVIDLVSVLEKSNKKYSVIGGAKLAGELDAKRAIREAYELVFKL